MAYGTKYTFSWDDAAGVSCEVRLQQAGYSDTSTSLTAAKRPFEATWGQQGQTDMTQPLLISTARIRFMGDSAGENVEEVFDSPDRQWRVQYLEGGSIEWQGYLAMDLWQDNPDVPGDVIELEAIDGLALLETEEAWTNDDGVHDQLTDILRETVRGLHDLPIWTSMDWHAHNADISSGQCPLDVYEVPEEAYKKVDESGDVEGPTDQRSQLEDICERYGLQLSQAGGAWHFRQRDQVDDGTALKRWRMGTSDLSFGSSTTDDVTASLPYQTARTEKPRSRVARLRSVKSSYSYDDLGELVRAGSFESGSLNGWTEDGGTNTVQKYDDTPLSIGSTQDDTYVLNMEYAFSQGEDQPKIHISQDVPALLHNAGPAAAYRFQWDEAREKGVAVINPTIGSYELNQQRVLATDAAEPADSGTVRIEPLPGLEGTMVIPQGMELPVFEAGGGPSIVSWITLSEAAYAKDEVLKGDISSDVPEDGEVRFYYWDGSSSRGGITGPRKPPGGTSSYRMDVQEILVPQHTTTGELVVGDMNLEVGTRDVTDGDPKVWVDHMSVQIVKEGEPIAETTYIALDDHFGRQRELVHRTGAGPTASHPRRLFDPVGGEDLLTGWKPAPYADGESSTGKGLEQLLAEQWMRQRRETLDRRTFQFEARGHDIGPQHVYSMEGTAYTPTFIRYTSSSYGNTGTIELTELKDAGISGLEQAFAMESDTSSGTGGGGSTLISDQTVEGAGSWDELTGKPTGLLANGGGSDEIDETIAATWANLNDKPFLQVGDQLNVDGSGNLDVVENGLNADTLDGTHLSDISFADISATRYTDSEAQAAVAQFASVTQVGFENNENTDGTRGSLAFDASEGLLLHRDKVQGDSSSTDDDFVVLDRGNIVGGNNLTISGGEGSGGAPVTFDVSTDPTFSDLSVDNDIRMTNGGIIGISGGPEIEFEGNGLEIQGVERLAFGDQGGISGLDMGGKQIVNTGFLEADSLKATGEIDANTYEVREFGSLGGNDDGSGVYTDSWRAYIGLIKLVDSDSKEWTYGRISGRRGSFARGGELEVYAENDDYNGDGTNINATAAYVKSTEGGGGARLVQFDYNGYTWVGIEYFGGGSGMSEDIKFYGRTSSATGSGEDYPRVISFSNISNLSAYSGTRAHVEEEFSNKELHGNLKLRDGHAAYLEGTEATTYQLRPAQNADTGVSIRATDNPATGDNIFTVEPSGSQTRFGVTQNEGAWMRDGLYVGDNFDNSSPGLTGGDMTVTGTADFSLGSVIVPVI